MKKNYPTESLWTRDFILITFTNLLIYCGFQMFPPTLPVHLQALGATDSLIGWLMGISMAAVLIVRPLTGIVLDRYGRKGMFILGTVLMTLSSLSYCLFTAFAVIFIIRIIHGIAWGISSTASQTIGADTIPAKRFGEGIGFFSISTSLAMAISPAIGLWVLKDYGITSMVMVATIMLGSTILLGFIIKYKPIEKKTGKIGSPFEKISLWPAIIVFFATAVYGAIVSYISLYATQRGIESIGSYFTVFAFALIAARFFLGKIIDTKGIQVVLIPGLIALSGTLVVLFFANTFPWFMLSAVLFGLGFGAAQSSLQTLAVVYAPLNRIGAANATFFTFFDGGIGFGMVIAGSIAQKTGYSNMFLILAIFPLLAWAIYIYYKNVIVKKLQIQSRDNRAL